MSASNSHFYRPATLKTVALAAGTVTTYRPTVGLIETRRGRVSTPVVVTEPRPCPPSVTPGVARKLGATKRSS